jgi:YggT family protein
MAQNSVDLLLYQIQYNLVITARILLSWFPQAQGIGLLQPVYAITDPYLNLFRGLIPPIFGLDLSPILAFFLLSTLGNATAAVGCEIPPQLQQKPSYSHQNMLSRVLAARRRTPADKSHPSMNY